MLMKVVFSSIRYRIRLYTPMIFAVSLSLSLIGASGILQNSFDTVVEKEMRKYGANVILKPENGEVENAVYPGDEWVAIYVKTARMDGSEISLAVTDVEKLMRMNPAWILKGEGNVIVGRELAERLGIESGDAIEVNGVKGRAAILDSGTEFDSFVILNGTAKRATMVLIRTDNPERYRSGDAIILEEMVRTKFSFLRGIEKLLLYIAGVSVVSSLITIVNLSRADAGKRRKEFGIMRAVGADTKMIGKFILTEFGILAVISALLGAIFSVILSWIILVKTADTLPDLSSKFIVTLISLSAGAFYAVSLMYLVESTRKDVVNELGGE